MENPKIDEYQDPNITENPKTNTKEENNLTPVADNAENLKVYMQPGSSVKFEKGIKGPIDIITHSGSRIHVTETGSITPCVVDVNGDQFSITPVYDPSVQVVGDEMVVTPIE